MLHLMPCVSRKGETGLIDIESVPVPVTIWREGMGEDGSLSREDGMSLLYTCKLVVSNVRRASPQHG